MHRRRGVSETPSVRMRMLGSNIRSKGSDTSEPKVFYGTQRAPQLRSRSSCDAVDYHWRVVTGHGACNWGPCRVDSLVVYRAGVVTSALGVRWSCAMYCRTVDAPPQRGWSHGTGRSSLTLRWPPVGTAQLPARSRGHWRTISLGWVPVSRGCCWCDPLGSQLGFDPSAPAHRNSI